jgi:hypothetical protein
VFYSDDPRDEVAFDQLPEQVREYYRLNIPKRTVWKVYLQETQAHLRFAPGPDEEGLGWEEFWEKAKDGWFFTEGWMAS